MFVKTGVTRGDPDDATSIERRGPVHARPIGTTRSLCGLEVIPLVHRWVELAACYRCIVCAQAADALG